MGIKTEKEVTFTIYYTALKNLPTTWGLRRGDILLNGV